MTNYEKFVALHHAETPLIIGNCWDVMSAILLEETGCQAVATSSAAIANAHGYSDGQGIPFETLFTAVKEISARINLPFSVDLERGFSDTIPGILSNIERFADIGAVGINIEDSLANDQLLPVDNFRKTLHAITDFLARKNIGLYVNARTDAFLLNLPDPLAVSLSRVSAYEAAGASGIFVPFANEISSIKTITAATSLPLNVLYHKDLPAFSELAAAGVHRISMGSSLFNAVKRNAKTMIENSLNAGSAAPFFLT